METVLVVTDQSTLFSQIHINFLHWSRFLLKSDPAALEHMVLLTLCGAEIPLFPWYNGTTYRSSSFCLSGDPFCHVQLWRCHFSQGCPRCARPSCSSVGLLALLSQREIAVRLQYQNSKDPPCCTGLYQT